MKLLIAIIALLVLPQVVYAVTPTDRAVMANINAYRVSHKLSSLPVSKELCKSAELKLKYMQKYKFYDHDWGGLSFKWWIRKYWQGDAAENLAFDQSTPQAMKEWHKSLKHRDNLKDSWTHQCVRSGMVELDGEKGLMIVSHFGTSP